MPLLNKTQVSPLPLPNFILQLPVETEVWLIRQTAEIFTDYESYANRYLFYSQPRFTPDLPEIQSISSKPVSFFQALKIEQLHLDHLIQSNFPSSLKPRLLSSILLPSTQLQPNIDHLVDHLYGLYHNRFDVKERVIVDLALNSSSSSSSSLHDARVIRVFPPKLLRDLDKESYSTLIHLGAVDRFELDLNKCLTIDDPEAYLYTIQLINDQKSNSDNFGASYMEVETKKLGRHPDSFSKPLLKRFLQSVLLPHSTTLPSARWTIHPDISLHPDNLDILPLPQMPIPSHTTLIKHLNLNQAVPSKRNHSQPDPKKRKKNSSQCPPSENPISLPPNHSSSSLFNLTVTCPPKRQVEGQVEPPPSESQSNPSPHPTDGPPRKKKKKPLNSTSSITPTPTNSQSNQNFTPSSELPNSHDNPDNTVSPTAPITATRESKKSIKYPIEDLDLDPLTVIDGRHLRRSNPKPLNMPKKPQPARQKLHRKFEQKLKIWSFVNVFQLNKRRCQFSAFDNSLDDLTASLVKLILKQSHLRYPNTSPNKFTSVSILPFFATRPAQECTVMSIEEREYWVRKGLRFLNLHRKAYPATSYHKKRLNRDTVSDDWVMGLVEIMCHRGGIERLGCTARILKYFFSKDATLLSIDHNCEEVDHLEDSTQSPQHCHSHHHSGQTNHVTRTVELGGDSPLTSNTGVNSDDHKSDSSVDEANVIGEEELEDGTETGDEEGHRFGNSIRDQRDHPKRLKKTLISRFEGLPVEDKMTLIDFMCELAMESDTVRNYIEECDEKLTVVRKEKADVNKEKRKVLEELTRLENRKVGSTPKVPPSLSSGELTSTQDGEPSPILDQCKSNGTELSITNPSAPPVELSEASGLGSQPSNEPDEDIKPKLSPPMSSSNPAISVELPSKPFSPQIKTSTNKHETRKPLSNRPLGTQVRIATLTARQIKEPSSLASNEAEVEKQQLEKQLFDIGLRELQLQERFRQLIGVTKLKPLGVDRFHCKYWWFDGIGGMEIHPDVEEKKEMKTNPNYNSDQEEQENVVIEQEDIKWYSGCLFVSGPCSEEWDKMCESYGGHDQILNRRLREEFGRFDDDDQLLLNDHLNSKINLVGVDEWGIYETEDQIEELINWLNSKGNRENSLKMNLKDWKEYIIYGIQGCHKLFSSTTTNDYQMRNCDTTTTQNPTEQDDPHSIEQNGFQPFDSRKLLKHEHCDGYVLGDCGSNGNGSDIARSNSIDGKSISSSSFNDDSIGTNDSSVAHSDHLDGEEEDD